MSEAEEIRARLTTAIEKREGQRVSVEHLTPLTGGASSQTWAFMATTRDGSRDLIFQRTSTDNPFVFNVTKSDQAIVQRAVQKTGAPVPNIRYILNSEDGLGDGYIADKVEGETLPQRLLRDQRYDNIRHDLARQCGETLAKIHSITPEHVTVLKQWTTDAQLAQLRQEYLNYGVALPVFDLAFQWLKDHLPKQRSMALVHGDFRNGNLMIGSDGIRAVLDWELSHIGDPYEDIAFISVRSWRFGHLDKPVGGFGQRQDLYDAYEAESGHSIDFGCIRFWEILGTLKWGVMCLFLTLQHLKGDLRSVERAAIGRRTSETEYDLIDLISRSN